MMFKKPRLPRPPPDEPETPSGAFRAYNDLKGKQNRLTYGAFIATVITLGTIGGGWYSVLTVSKTQAQEVVVPLIAPLDAGLKSANERLEFFKDEFKRHIVEEADHHRRAEQQQELMMDALNVPKWKRPAPVQDGGK